MKRIYPNITPFGDAFNAARLTEAKEIFNIMTNSYDTTIACTMAGALTPAGIGGNLIELIKKGFIDFIISTGANLYHDIHFALDLPVFKGSLSTDDYKLQKDEIVRIYDIFIPFKTLFDTDKYLQENMDLEGSFSSAEIHYHIGKKLLKNSAKPEYSVLATAAKYEVPVYCPSPGDSSIGMNVAYLQAKGKTIYTNVEKDVLETAALIYQSVRSGGFILGGGAPKNFFMQTQPMLSQILDLPEKGHEYFVQVTSDSPHWGGLSGATSNEAITWNKIDAESKTHVTVYGDCTIIAPLIFSEISSKKRSLKRLYTKRDDYTDKLIQSIKK